MIQWKSSREREVQPGMAVFWPSATVAAFAGSTAAGLLAIVLLAPAALVLPVVSLVAIAGAAIVALLAWWRGAERASNSVTGWDVAGALALIGFSAGILTDSDQILQLISHGTTPR
jgi:Flp pilus assembly protein TadB